MDGEIVEQAVGSVFTFVRRSAMGSYYDDWRACDSVARAGYRFGWALNAGAFHLGWDNFELHPGHLASKRRYGGEYREVHLIARAPSLGELATAGPLIAETRRAGVADAAVLELAWADTPPVTASVPGTVGICARRATTCRTSVGPFGCRSCSWTRRASAPRSWSVEACRVSRGPVIAVAPLKTFDGRAAAELSPPGWRGREQAGPGELATRVGRSLDADDLAMKTLDDRERWLDVFARAAFGNGDRRLWIWEPLEPAPLPDEVIVDPSRVTPWEAVAGFPPESKLRPLHERVIDRARQRRRVAVEVSRARSFRRRRPAPQQR